jgi:hypothetical protein
MSLVAEIAAGCDMLKGVARSRLMLLLCLAAVAGCGGGKTRAPAARSHEIVLGESGFVRGAPGWGDAHPRSITVGGDPALVINDIRWSGWGRPQASGVGRAAAFTYHGGSTYRRQVRVELRAYQLGRCAPSGPRAYQNLRLRMPRRPGAPMGQWFVLGGGPRGLCRPR